MGLQRQPQGDSLALRQLQALLRVGLTIQRFAQLPGQARKVATQRGGGMLGGPLMRLRLHPLSGANVSGDQAQGCRKWQTLDVDLTDLRGGDPRDLADALQRARRKPLEHRPQSAHGLFDVPFGRVFMGRPPGAFAIVLERHPQSPLGVGMFQVPAAELDVLALPVRNAVQFDIAVSALPILASRVRLQMHGQGFGAGKIGQFQVAQPCRAVAVDHRQHPLDEGRACQGDLGRRGGGDQGRIFGHTEQVIQGLLGLPMLPIVDAHEHLAQQLGGANGGHQYTDARNKERRRIE